nr:MAG TPA: hypothetical protein [Caudoviricetes sp.]
MDNNNTSALVTANSANDKNDANNVVNDREFTRTADMAARAITCTQRFVKTHYRGLLATAGAATALGILYAIRKNHDADDTVDDTDNVEYEFADDSSETVDDTPVSNNTL